LEKGIKKLVKVAELKRMEQREEMIENLYRSLKKQQETVNMKKEH